MKIAVISDIHGNMQAFEAVLEDIKKINADKIFCLGDLAMAGPEPTEAIDKVIELEKSGLLTVIQGNTDLFLAQNSQEVCDNIKKVSEPMGYACESDIKLLQPEHFEYLKNLAPQKELIIDGVKILLVHGSPRANNENIYPEMSLSQIEEMVKDTDADIIFCGHTHQPCGYQTDSEKTVVNVGSVGRPLSEVPKACYAVIEINPDTEEEKLAIYHRLVDYDKEKTAELLRCRNYVGADKIAQMLICASERYPN